MKSPVPSRIRGFGVNRKSLGSASKPIPLPDQVPCVWGGGGGGGVNHTQANRNLSNQNSLNPVPGTVETVLSDLVLLVVGVVDGVHVRVVGHGLVERRVENGNLGHLGEHLLRNCEGFCFWVGERERGGRG